MAVNCIRCTVEIPPADLFGTGTAMDASGNMLCVSCTLRQKSGGAGPEPGPAARPPSWNSPGGVGNAYDPTPALGMPRVQTPGSGSSALRRPLGGQADSAVRPPAGGSSALRRPVGSSGSSAARPPARGSSAQRRPAGSSALRRPLDSAGPGSAAGRVRGYLPPGGGRSSSTPLLVVLIILVLVGLAGGFAWIRQKDLRALEDKRAVAKRALDDVDALARNAPKDVAGRLELARRAVELAQGTEKFEGIAAKRLDEVARAAAAAAAQAADLQKLEDRLEQIEKDAGDPSRAEAVRRELGELEARVDPDDEGVQKKLERIRKRLGGAQASATLAAAKERQGRTPGDYDGILGDLERAFDEARAQGKAGDAQLVAIAAEIDRVSRAKYDAGYEAAQPWVDLLSADWLPRWKRVAPAESIVMESAGGEMVVSGVAHPDCHFGILHVGTDYDWIDVVVEMEFAIEALGFNVLGRCGKSRGVVRYGVECKEGTNLKEGQTYTLKVAIKGFRGEIALGDGSTDTFNIPAGLSRTGGFGLALDPGARVRFKAIRAKVLRAASPTTR